MQNMRGKGNIRRHERFDLNAKARVSWTDRFGRDKWASVTLSDASASGIQLNLPEWVEPRSILCFNSDNPKMQGQATVRFCKPQGNLFVVGAEFVGHTSWNAPK